MQEDTSPKSIDLKSQYPVTLRLAFMKSFRALFVAFWFGGFYVATRFNFTDAFFKLESLGLRGFAVSTLLVVGYAVINLSYQLLNCWAIRFGVRNWSFFMSKGVIIKERASFPLSRITDIYVDQSWPEYFWKIKTLRVSTPSSESSELTKIEGLSDSSAANLRNRLELMIHECRVAENSQSKEKLLAASP